MNLKGLAVVVMSALLLAACGQSEPEFVPEKQFNPTVKEPMPVFDASSGIVLEAKGLLSGTDPAAQIVGEIRLYRAPNTSGLVRIENLVVPEPMRLDLVLTRSATPTAADGLERAAELGALRGSNGSMNILIEPDQLDFAAYQAVALLSYPDRRVIATALLNRQF